MSWRESGGPMVTEPKCWGFGRQAIQRLTAQALAGKATHEFAPDGVKWTLDIPAAVVVTPEQAHARSWGEPKLPDEGESGCL
jgi:two-component sensor histidine kinase